MNRPTTQHRSEAQLASLLRGDCDPSQELEATIHIANCERCRESFDSLAADKHWWSEIAATLSSNPSFPFVEQHTTGLSTSEANDRDANPTAWLAPSDNPAMIGRLGDFDVLEIIGQGGMGIVFKGYDCELNRWVAIKSLRPQLAKSAVAKKRFVRESQAAAAVVHPNVVPIHSVCSEGRPPYFVMAYVPGESLHQRLDREGALPVVEILRIALQTAEGLAEAHSQGLIHRDIKPANILLERNIDRVVLVDFGLARNAQDTSLTIEGVVAGTPEFMSPEQAKGDVVDARTDLFSLGSVMHAMATGLPPHRAESPYALLRQVIDTDPDPVHSINPEMPPFLSELIKQFLTRDRAKRIQTSRAAAELIRSVLAHVQHPTVNMLPLELQGSGKPKMARSYKTAAMLISIAVPLLSIIFLSNSLLSPFLPTQDQLLGAPTGSSEASSDQSSASNSLAQVQQTRPAISTLLSEIRSEPGLESIANRVDEFLQCVEWDSGLQQLKLNTDYEAAKQAYATAYQAAYMAQADQCEIRNKRRDLLISAETGIDVPGFDIAEQKLQQQHTLELIDDLMQLQISLDRIANQVDLGPKSW
jgi:eukaryotic-like serine/threonine-protein kinase